MHKIEFAIGVILLAIDYIFIGSLRWVWRRILALLSPKPTVTITPLSAEYYKKTYDNVFGNLGNYIRTEYDIFQPPEVRAHNKPYDEYMFLKIDIDNETGKYVELEECRVELLNPRRADMSVNTWPGYEEQITPYPLRTSHFLKSKLPECKGVNMSNLVTMPIRLKPDDDNIYKYLCVQIINWPEIVYDTRLKIEMREGRSSNIRTYSSIVMLDKYGDSISIKKYSVWWKHLKHDENGKIKWSC